jgi:uncharacterized caspase-like protein
MLLSLVVPVHADRHVALVIGNNRYAGLPVGEQLQKATNGARSVSGALQQIGFEVRTMPCRRGRDAERTH